jgi:adenylate cyclase
MPDVGRVATLAGIDASRLQEWVDAGLFQRVDENTADWVARAHIVSQLERAGVPIDMIKAAEREDVLARAYIYEFLQVARRGDNLFRNVAESTGIEEQLLLRICDALGIEDASSFSDSETAFLNLLGETMRLGLTPAMTLEFCEIWGSQMRFIAHAEMIAYDTNLSRKFFAESVSPLEAAAALAPLTRMILRTLDLAAQPLHRRHLLQAMSLETDTMLASHAGGEVLPPGEVLVAIGFIDLTGFTTLTEEEGDQRALTYTRRLERVVAESIRDRGGRIVKRLGDGLMLASSEIEDLIGVLLDTMAALEARDDMPPARAGVGYGHAVSRGGDYFGRTVNVAARALDEAEPYEVLCTDEACQAVESETLRFSKPRDSLLQGIREPVRLWRVERSPTRRSPKVAGDAAASA